MSFKKIVKQFFLYTFLLFITLVSVAAIFIYANEDKIMNAFISEVNKHAQTEIHIKSKEISFLESFPNVSIHLENVRIKGSETTSEDYLAHFNDLFLDFNIIKLIKGNYAVEKVHAYSGGVNIFIDEKGRNNYSFYKSSKDQKEDVTFKIKFVELVNIDFMYHNDSTNQLYAVDNIKGNGHFLIKNKQIESQLKAKANVEKIKVGNNIYFSDKKIHLNGKYIHYQENLNGKLNSTTLILNGSNFKVNGEIQPKKDRYFFKVKSKKTSINTLFSLLPNAVSKPFHKYKSEGNVHFSAKILKKTEDIFPAINANFGLNNVKVTEPTTGAQLSKLKLEGIFSNGKKRSNNSSSLILKNIDGFINKREIQGDLTLSNFDDIYLSTTVKGELDLVSFTKFIQNQSSFKIENGVAVLDASLSARLKDLKNSNTEKINSSGKITFKNTAFHFRNAPIEKLNGDVLFKKNKIAISNITSKIGNSDLAINGIIQNPFSSILYGNKKLIISMETRSNLVESDSLIKYFITDDVQNNKTGSKQVDYVLNFKSKANKITFNQFNLNRFEGALSYYNGVINFPKIRFSEAEGDIDLRSTINLKNKDKIHVEGVANFDNINIKKAFHLFNNFDQDFLKADNLEGKLSLDIRGSFDLDTNFEISSKSINLTAACEVKDGQLVNFEPMQKMSSFLKRKELDNISFSDLENTISIKNETITIPEMDIHSSASDIVVSGTHTFDQKINYKIKFPLKNFSAPDKDAAFGAIEESGNSSNVHLKITGTTDDYKISYDTKATKEKIKSNIKNEIKEFKDLIKGDLKEDSIIQIGLEEEEYFEFD